MVIEFEVGPYDFREVHTAFDGPRINQSRVSVLLYNNPGTIIVGFANLLVIDISVITKFATRTFTLWSGRRFNLLFESFKGIR